MMHQSGLVVLADAVRVYFDANGVRATVAPVGLRYRSFSMNQGPGGGSRIVFIPGDFSGDAALKPIDEGELGDPLKRLGDNPRELVEWNRTVTISIWGVDASDVSDEQRQIEATENLLELVVRAVHNAVSPNTGYAIGADRDENGSSTWGKVSRTYPPVENGFGCELLVRLRIKGPLFDAPAQIVTPTLAPLVRSTSLGA